MSDAQNTMNHARETVRQWDTTDPLAMNVESWFMHFGSELSCRLGDLSLFREHAPPLGRNHLPGRANRR